MFEQNWSILSNLEAWDHRVGDSFWVLWNLILWKAESLVVHHQFIHFKFTNPGGIALNFTFTYGHGIVQERRVLWESLCQLAPTSTDQNWVVLGDLNEVTQSLERKGPGVYSEHHQNSEL